MATGDGDVPDGVGVGVMAGTDVLGEVHPRTRVAARATVGEDVPIGEGAAVDARIASEAAEHEGAGRSLSALVGRQEGVDDIDSCSESEGPITRTSALTHDNKERPCTYAPSLEGAQPSERRRVAVLAPGGTEDFAPMLELAAGVCSLGDNAIVLCDKRFFTDVDALGMLHMAVPGPECSDLTRAQSPAILEHMLAACEPLVQLAREGSVPHLLVFNYEGASGVCGSLLAELLGCPAAAVAPAYGVAAHSDQEESPVLAGAGMGAVKRALRERHGDRGWRRASCLEAEALSYAPFAGVAARWRADNGLPPLQDALECALGSVPAARACARGGTLALLRARATPTLHLRSPELFPPPSDWGESDLCVGSLAGGDELIVPTDTVCAALDGEVKRQFPKDARESDFDYRKRFQGVRDRMEQMVDSETGLTYRQTKLRELRARYRAEVWTPPRTLVDFCERWKSTNAPILVEAGLPQAKLRVLLRAMGHRSRRCVLEPGAVIRRKVVSTGGHVMTDTTDWSLAGLCDSGTQSLVHELDASEAVPRAWLLERCRLYVHTGSALACACALQAGVPSLCAPSEYDQRARAAALHARGLCPEPLPAAELTAEAADAALNAALEHRRARLARVVGECVRGERAPLRAAHILRELARMAREGSA